MRHLALCAYDGLLLASSFLALTTKAQDVSPEKPGNYTNLPINYVREWQAYAPITDPDVLMTRPSSKQVMQSTQYIDGLGRPLQTVTRQGSLINGGNPRDMIVAKAYDPLGREARKYLPFASNGGVGVIDDGSFKTNPFDQQQDFYSDLNINSPVRGQGETYYYSKTEFETSSLSRIERTYAPGDNWVHQGKGIKIKYCGNTATDNVRIWKVNNGANVGDFGSYTSIDAYGAGQLFKTITEDEHEKQVIEFKDKEGKVILKKVQIANNAYDDGILGTNYNGWLCTYHIYDDWGQLRCVIQPEAVKTLAGNGWDLTNGYVVLLTEQCFRYEYDERGRMIAKKVPGADPVYMVYDKRDRLVMTQDGNMGSGGTKKWLVTLYDDLNRPVGTGLWTNASSGTAHAVAAQNSPDYFYPFTQANVPSSGWEELTATFYDNYDWVNLCGNPVGSVYNTAHDGYFQAASNSTWPYPQANAPFYPVKGLVTGSRVKVLGTINTFIYTVTFYDDKGRVLQVQTKNKEGGLEILTTQYTWAGQSLASVQAHQKTSGGPVVTTLTQLTYDDLGRVTKIEKKIAHPQVNGGAMPAVFTTVSEQAYDALGQLKSKSLGRQKNAGGAYTTTPLETLAYNYNIRGWLLNLNKGFLSGGTASTTNYFGLELSYDKDGVAQNARKQYNGNIGESAWRSRGDDEERKYDYSYDAANRLLKADFTQVTGTNAANVNFNIAMGDGADPATAYDANGNILRMSQWGLLLNSSAQIDNLFYFYTGNHLKLVGEYGDFQDADRKLGDFIDKNRNNIHFMSTGMGPAVPNYSGTDDYAYDANGNLTVDNNKSISAIAYNHLNLPSLVTVTGKGTVGYVYDASGTKLQKQTNESGATVRYNNSDYTGLTIITTTDYENGFVYESKQYTNNTTLNTALGYTNKLQFGVQEEGRVRALYYNATNPNLLTGFAYDYMLKDHLGNVRMVLTEEKKTDPYPVVTFQDAALTDEETYYENVDVYREEHDIYGTDNSNSPPNKVQSLRKNTTAVGAGKLLKVMAGDRLHVKVDYFIPDLATDNSSADGIGSAVTSLFTLLNGGVMPALKDGATTITNNLSTPGNDFATFLQSQTTSVFSSLPKAYLNILFFDEQFHFVPQGSETVQVDTKGSVATLTRLQSAAKEATKNGYAYIYLSNESNNVVFFDNFQIIGHERSPILEETHYYPFGLMMAGISSKAAGLLTNRYKFNGKEEQQEEFADGEGLNSYDYKNRFYDYQIGRFFEIDKLSDKFFTWSPYQFAGNQVPNAIDLDGLEPNRTTGQIATNFIYTNQGVTQAQFDAFVAQHQAQLNGYFSGSQNWNGLAVTGAFNFSVGTATAGTKTGPWTAVINVLPDNGQRSNYNSNNQSIDMNVNQVNGSAHEYLHFLGLADRYIPVVQITTTKATLSGANVVSYIPLAIDPSVDPQYFGNERNNTMFDATGSGTVITNAQLNTIFGQQVEQDNRMAIIQTRSAPVPNGPLTVNNGQVGAWGPAPGGGFQFQARGPNSWRDAAWSPFNGNNTTPFWRNYVSGQNAIGTLYPLFRQAIQNTIQRIQNSRYF